jgi:uncharacterized protein YwqG
MSSNDDIDVSAIAAHLHGASIAGADRLATLAEHSWRITTRRVPMDALQIGESRFGGAPDVPADFVWPTLDGRPLHFLSQLDLAEVGSRDLPAEGWLLFFYDAEEQPWGFDPNDAGGSKVIFVAPERRLARRLPPAALDPLQPCALTLEQTVDLPDPYDSIVADAGIELPIEQAETYANKVKEMARRQLPSFDAQDLYHHLLGHPQLVQNDMRRECQLASNGIYVGEPTGYRGDRAEKLLASAPSEWRLLLQLDTDEEGPGWMWGDVGRIYFWIRKSDLAAHAFDRTWLVLQCS